MSFERRSRRGIMGWWLVLVLGGIACGDSESDPPVTPPVAVEAAPTPAPPPDPHAAEEAADREISAKIGPIIRECLNRHNEPVNRARARYFDWVDAETGPTGSERNVRGTGELHGTPDACVRAIEESRAATPVNATLDAAALAYGSALEQVYQRVNDAHTYYERENYKDDSFAGARERHTPLVEAFSAFSAASTALDTEVTTINDGITTRRLARMEGDPQRELELLSERTLLLGRQILESTDGWTVEDEKLVGIELEAFSARVTELEALADRLVAKKAEGIDARVDRVSHMFFDHFVRDAGELVTAAKATMRRVRDAQAFSTGELMRLSGASASSVDGSPPAMTQQFNEMVNAFNRVRWIQG